MDCDTDELGCDTDELVVFGLLDFPITPVKYNTTIITVIIIILVAIVMLYATCGKKRKEGFTGDVLDFLDRMIKNQDELNKYELEEEKQTNKINELNAIYEGLASWLY